MSAAPQIVAAPPAYTPLLRGRPAPTGFDRVFATPIEHDYMEPTFRDGDFVLAVPCSHFFCDNLYVVEQFGKLVVCRAQRVFGARPLTVAWWFDNSNLSRNTCADERFNAIVRGYVCGEVRITDREAFAGGLPLPLRRAVAQ